jgi:hypothetical protein
MGTIRRDHRGHNFIFDGGQFGEEIDFPRLFLLLALPVFIGIFAAFKDKDFWKK